MPDDIAPHGRSGGGGRSMLVLVWISVCLFLVLLVLLPFVFAELLASALVKLHLSHETAVLLTLAMFVGGLINIPVRRIPRETLVPVHPLAVFGLDPLAAPGAAAHRERDRRERGGLP